MELGAFSVSLAVKDIAKSKAFYEVLGFQEFHGDQAQGWLVMANGSTKIGLFQGMFEDNIMTFNPGWDQNAQSVAGFVDVREIQAKLKAAGASLMAEADAATTGPANCMVQDPDGNTILLDQHI